MPVAVLVPIGSYIDEHAPVENPRSIAVFIDCADAEEVPFAVFRISMNHPRSDNYAADQRIGPRALDRCCIHTEVSFARGASLRAICIPDSPQRLRHGIRTHARAWIGTRTCTGGHGCGKRQRHQQWSESRPTPSVFKRPNQSLALIFVGTTAQRLHVHELHIDASSISTIRMLGAVPTGDRSLLLIRNTRLAVAMRNVLSSRLTAWMGRVAQQSFCAS